MKKNRNTQGFTVLELVLFILVVGIVVATAFSRVDHEKQNTRNKEREGDVKTVQLAIEAYYAKNSFYPKASGI
jgi:type II secretory pathway pseudopilin PulG